MYSTWRRDNTVFLTCKQHEMSLLISLTAVRIIYGYLVQGKVVERNVANKSIISSVAADSRLTVFILYHVIL